MKPWAGKAACPCGRPGAKGQGLAYASCCGRYLESDEPAPDAESLMRSRYSAFVLEREAYLLATWHASTRPDGVSFDAGVKWLGLEVRSVRALGPDLAQVEFVARHKPASGSAVRLHETSEFAREGARWLYLHGSFGRRNDHDR